MKRGNNGKWAPLCGTGTWSPVTSLNIPFAVNKVVLGDGEAGHRRGRWKTTVGHPGQLATGGSHPHKPK